MFNFGCFVNDQYMPCFISLYKSINYYMKDKANVVVYNYDQLSQLNRNKILSLPNCEIIDIPQKIKQHKNYYIGCAWRSIVLKELGMKYNCMIFLDIDMVLLDDISDLFQLVENGNIIGSNEWTYDIINDSKEQKTLLEEFNKNIWNLVQKKYSKSFKIYNGGLLGFNYSKHKLLLQKWGEAFNYFPEPNCHTNDQFVISFLMSLLDITPYNLDCRYYMNTWHNHNKPRKLVGFDNGKLCMYHENDLKNKIRLYHYTGDIGMNKNGQCITYRFYHYIKEIADNSYERKFFSKDDLRQMSRDLWEKHHNSPALMVNEFFNNL